VTHTSYLTSREQQNKNRHFRLSPRMILGALHRLTTSDPAGLVGLSRQPVSARGRSNSADSGPPVLNYTGSAAAATIFDNNTPPAGRDHARIVGKNGLFKIAGETP